MEAIYDVIGEGYDTTRKADPGILLPLCSLLEIGKGKRYLDVACGTGNYTSALALHAGKWSAFDRSEKMLREARSKSTLVDWRLYDVVDLGYGTDRFDGAICTLAIHHFADLPESFLEIARVLKSKGRFVIFTALPDQMESYWLNHYFPVMMERSRRKMPSLECIETALHQAGFIIEATQPFFVSPDIQDLFLYSGKHKPGIYLSASVRRGISSFPNLCSQPELDNGIGKLRVDIDSGRIREVIDNCENKEGDYLFICACAR